MRILAISDLHTDFRENKQLLEEIPAGAYQQDTLIAAGDISDNLETLQSTLALLRSRFKQVFYVPGNHELWVRRSPSTSVEKFYRVLEVCESLDVQTSPQQVQGIWVVPLFSWYDPQFDEDGSADDESLLGWADFHLCKWPREIGQVCTFFLQMNVPHLRAYDGPVISFSHFLPRRDLLPPTEHLRFKGLPKVAGCVGLDRQIRQLRASVHVFGHSHIGCDRVIDGIRYVQNPLRYPRERLRPDLPIKIIVDTSGDTTQAPPSG